MKQIGKKPELLCPAGSPMALAAALDGGADAVYMGGLAFNARIHAKNFTADELREGIALAHSFGAKVYLTANTLIFDRETDEALRAAEDAYLAGADALIVADCGMAQAIRRRVPIELHASTQLSGHNADAAKFLADAGFSRMVCAREMGKEELSLFVRNSPIEAEVFVHGALCVCHSGQCLFSSVVGGRSGNRGECAQPCRLPYANGKNPYPLSLKDLCLARHVTELCDMGIASFKIEGRMKSPEYVRDVTKIWRRLLDENRNASEEEMTELASVFSRGGLTDGYYCKQIDRRMMGIRSERDKQDSRERTPFVGIERKLPVSLSASLRSGCPSRLSLCLSDGRSVTVEGDIPETAKTAPMEKEAVLRSLCRFGNTDYEITEKELNLDEGLMMPVSALNRLRRQASEALDALRREKNLRSAADFLSPAVFSCDKRTPKKGQSAVFYDPTQIPAEAHEAFDILYIPLERYDGSTDGVLLPPVIFDTERPEIEQMMSRAVSLGAKHVLVGNAGHLAMARQSGMKVHGDFRLNVTNSASADFWQSVGLDDVILSPELTMARARDIGGRVMVYGRIPLMVTEKCLGRELADCTACQKETVRLIDRRKTSFPVQRTWNHRSLIFNSVPVYMADREEELLRHRIVSRHFLFTTESRQQILNVLEAYQKHLPTTEPIRRLR